MTNLNQTKKEDRTEWSIDRIMAGIGSPYAEGATYHTVEGEIDLTYIHLDTYDYDAFRADVQKLLDQSVKEAMVLKGLEDFAIFREERDKAVTIAVEEFAKKVEEEVIGIDQACQEMEVSASYKKGWHWKSLGDRYIRNKLRKEQRQALKLLVKKIK